jgi:hypothetical protein
VLVANCVVQPDGRIVERRHRWLALLGALVVFVPSVTNCGGRSSRVGGDGDGDAGERQFGGDGGTSSGGVRATGGAPQTGGVSPTGVPATGGVAPTGGVAGTGVGGIGGMDPGLRCYDPLDPGVCDAIVPSFGYDVATGLCLPFNYGGCEGNLNRFSTAEECYGWCGGRGVRDLASCSASAECVAERIAEPCCRTYVREFVGINIRNELPPCDQSALGCRFCAADCATTPEDGYIGAQCVDGHCIAYDYRDLAVACDTSEQCYLRYGTECCTVCDSGQNPSKLVALSNTLDLYALACGENTTCSDSCNYDGFYAQCVNGTCRAGPVAR